MSNFFEKLGAAITIGATLATGGSDAACKNNAVQSANSNKCEAASLVQEYAAAKAEEVKTKDEFNNSGSRK